MKESGGRRRDATAAAQQQQYYQPAKGQAQGQGNKQQLNTIISPKSYQQQPGPPNGAAQASKSNQQQFATISGAAGESNSRQNQSRAAANARARSQNQTLQVHAQQQSNGFQSNQYRSSGQAQTKTGSGQPATGSQRPENLKNSRPNRNSSGAAHHHTISGPGQSEHLQGHMHTNGGAKQLQSTVSHKSSSGQVGGQSGSRKHMRSVSLSKRLAMQAAAENQQIQEMQQQLMTNKGTTDQMVNNAAQVQQQLNSLLANKRLVQQQQQPTSNRQANSRASQPVSTQNRRTKHTKAFSMVQTTRPGATNNGSQPIPQGQHPGFNQTGMPFSGRVPCTEQFLNQPLQLNQQLMNANENQQLLQRHLQQQHAQQQQQSLQPLNNTQQVQMPFSDLQTPNDYMTIGGGESLGDGRGSGFTGFFSPKDLAGHLRWTNETRQVGAQGGPNVNGQAPPGYQHSSYSFIQTPPFPAGIVTGGSNQQLSSQGSGINQQQLNQNQTGRSFSHCSKKEFKSVSSGKIQKLHSVPEAQLIESDEHFESGKVLLGDKNYKEALKMFSKSLTANKYNFDALFYRAVTLLDSGQPQKSILDLNELIEVCPDYRKTVYIVLSIAHRRVNDYVGALRTLSKALMRYPRYIEAYIARGQVYIYQKKWEKALSDFRAVVGQQPHNGLGFLGQGDALKGMGNLNGALVSFAQAIEVDSKTVSQGLMKRGLLYLQMKSSELALQDFTKLTELAEDTNDKVTTVANAQSNALSKAYFYKAKALKKLSNLNDAVLYFEQVIQLNEDNHLASSALYEIAKIKIQQKDFYEAYYNLKRSTHLKLKQKKLVNYKMFTEGVIFLMKRKTKTGLKLITQLIDRIKPATADTPRDYIYNLVYLYRAYAYFVSEEYENSLKDYLKANQIKKLNSAALYNMSLTQGLKALNMKEFENAISFFSKSQQKMPENRDPYLLRAIGIVCFAMSKPIKPKMRTKMLKDAKRDLNRALGVSPKDCQVLYLRGLLNFSLHYFYDAIIDLEMVIEKADDANAKHYLARGRCYACLSMFKEAITDLSIAINLNGNLLDAYLNRGKCAYLIGDTGLAFMDFQKLIVIDPKNPMVHIYAGNLLMTTGSYEDATKAFTNADDIHKSALALYQRARCNVALNNMGEALKDLNKVLETAPSDKVAVTDRECLNALKVASINNPTDKPDVKQNVEKQQYEKSSLILTKLISSENNEQLAKITHESSIQHLHSQMIPSAQRTKTDKIRALRRRKEQDRLVKEGKMKKNDLRFRVQQQQEEEDDDEFEDLSELEPEELSKLNHQLEAGSNATQGADLSEDDLAQQKNEDEANYYKENIFNREDFYLYRGVMQIYLGEYKKAMTDFNQSSGIMHANKVLYPKKRNDDESGQSEQVAQDEEAASHASSQTDLSDVGLCSLNIHEFSFNSLICMLALKQYKQAIQKVEYLLDTVPKKYTGQLWLIRAMIHKVLGNTVEAKKDQKRALKHDNENASKFLEHGKSVELTVFPQQQRLCYGFAFLKTPLANGSAHIYLRPSFSFPFIKPPNMIPCVENSVLDTFSPTAVPLKPEAPWIKKCSFGIKFTDEIFYTDDERENTPDEEKEGRKRKDQEGGEGDDQSAPEISYVRSHSEKIVLKHNIFTPENEEEEDQEDFIVDDEQYEEEN